MRGSLFTVIGHVAGEGLRLLSNLLLTRLLFPEAFGLMAIATAVLQGARMLSDVGIRGSIVQHERGAEPAFTNTA
jgi:O-antigen/teichoic acid export membrane protein